MIRIDKAPRAPPVLCTQGSRRRRAHSLAYRRDSVDFQSHARTFEFDRSIYAHETVKDALLQAQHHKCCFCESKVRHVAFGDIEHFRPKAAVRQAAGGPLQHPGYYWLAYDWQNLYFCCEICNRRQKASLFPLLNPSARVRDHRHAKQLNTEQPLFIDPGNDEPERLLAFREGVAYPIDANNRATQTIDSLGLNRDELYQRRRECLAPLRVCVSVLLKAHQGSPLSWDLVDDAAKVVAASSEEGSEYTNAVRCMLRAAFGQPKLRFPLVRNELLAYASGSSLPTT